jgi:hypothetical protein
MLAQHLRDAEVEDSNGLTAICGSLLSGVKAPLLARCCCGAKGLPITQFGAPRWYRPSGHCIMLAPTWFGDPFCVPR